VMRRVVSERADRNARRHLSIRSPTRQCWCSSDAARRCETLVASPRGLEMPRLKVVAQRGDNVHPQWYERGWFKWQ
jgi:hypothetical protein